MRKTFNMQMALHKMERSACFILVLALLLSCLPIYTASAEYTEAQVEAAITKGLSVQGSTSWSGKCLKFVNWCFGKNYGFSSATTAGDRWVSHPGDYNPPRGTLIFWNGGLNGWGHIAISLGEGNMLHTTGPNGAVQKTTMTLDGRSSQGNPLYYRGWGYFGNSLYTGSSIPVNNITITGQGPNYQIWLTKNRTLQLTAVVSPDNASNNAVSWSSSDPTRATVSSTGLVTGVSSGLVYIAVEAQDGSGVKAEQEFFILSITVGSVEIVPSSKTLYTGETFQLAAVIIPEDAKTKP